MPQDFSPDLLWAIRSGDMKESALLDIYGAMEADRLTETVFYDGAIAGPASFLEFALRPGQEFRAVYHDQAPLGMVWLNNPQGLACMIHFCILRAFWPQQRAIGIWTTRQFLEPVNPRTSRPYLSALYGLTPARYRHALDFIQSIGFRLLGKIPGACEFQGKSGPVYRDGVASVLTLADIPTI